MAERIHAVRSVDRDDRHAAPLLEKYVIRHVFFPLRETLKPSARSIIHPSQVQTKLRAVEVSLTRVVTLDEDPDASPEPRRKCRIEGDWPLVKAQSTPKFGVIR